MSKNKYTEDKVELLKREYPDKHINNSQYLAFDLEEPKQIQGQTFIKLGMKESYFENVKYSLCKLKNIAFTGSKFRYTKFNRTNIDGSSFACCDFFETEINGQGVNDFYANNFSQSCFEKCRIKNLNLYESGLLNALFHNCLISNVKIKSSTLEGTQFVNCEIAETDLSSVNIEFVHFCKTTFKNVLLPFYQFPYIVGAADYIGSQTDEIALVAGNKIISMQEYIGQIDKLIAFFESKNEYFPICNLFIFKSDTLQAIEYLLKGVNKATEERDFRTLRYFCKLANHHNILDEITRMRILNCMDNFISNDNIPETQLNYYLMHIGEIQTLLRSGGSSSVTLKYNIKTNVEKSNQNGLDYVNSLFNELNCALSSEKEQKGFQISVVNFSPFEILVSVVALVESTATIASLIWTTIDHVKEKQANKNMVQIDRDVYQKYVDARIDRLRSDLLRMQKEYSEKKFSKYIDEVTQQIKTDFEELYSKDVMIFKINNK